MKAKLHLKFAFFPFKATQIIILENHSFYSLHTDFFFFCVTQTYFKFKQDWTQNKANHKTNSKQLIFKILFFNLLESTSSSFCSSSSSM
mgnify:CR=1 FL=1